MWGSSLKLDLSLAVLFSEEVMYHRPHIHFLRKKLYWKCKRSLVQVNWQKLIRYELDVTVFVPFKLLPSPWLTTLTAELCVSGRRKYPISTRKHLFHYEISNWIQLSKYLIIQIWIWHICSCNASCSSVGPPSINMSISLDLWCDCTWQPSWQFGESARTVTSHPHTHTETEGAGAELSARFAISWYNVCLSRHNYQVSQWNWEYLITGILDITIKTAWVL